MKHYQIESNIVRCPNPEYAEQMINSIDVVRVRGDSVGGVVTCIVRNAPRVGSLSLSLSLHVTAVCVNMCLRMCMCQRPQLLTFYKLDKLLKVLDFVAFFFFFNFNEYTTKC